MRSFFNYFKNFETCSSTKGKTFPLILGSTSTRPAGGGGEVSIFKPLSMGSGENQSKINIEIQYTKHERQRVQPFFKYTSFQNTNIKVFSELPEQHPLHLLSRRKCQASAVV